MLDIFQYSFILRGLEAGIIIGILAPFIGIFLVLRRYSLIADTLAHVSLAGIAIGILLNINPILTAIISTTVSSITLDRLRISKRVYGESALAMYLSGSLAIALILISIGKGFNINLLNYLFGSIVTVKESDVALIASLGVIVITLLILFFKELFFITMDEELAQVSGIPTKFINTLFISLAAITIALAIPIVGILLISALIVIPVIAALQLRQSFIKSIFIAEGISLLSVVSGIISSYYLNIPAGATIVMITIIAFMVISLLKKR